MDWWRGLLHLERKQKRISLCGVFNQDFQQQQAQPPGAESSLHLPVSYIQLVLLQTQIKSTWIGGTAKWQFWCRWWMNEWRGRGRGRGIKWRIQRKRRVSLPNLVTSSRCASSLICLEEGREESGFWINIVMMGRCNKVTWLDLTWLWGIFSASQRLLVFIPTFLLPPFCVCLASSHSWGSLTTTTTNNN